VEVQEEVFEGLGGLTLSLAAIDQREALRQDPFHDVSPDPVGGPKLAFEGVVRVDQKTSILRTRPRLAVAARRGLGRVVTGGPFQLSDSSGRFIRMAL